MSGVFTAALVAAQLWLPLSAGGPCRAIEPNEAQRRSDFANAVARGTLALLTLTGDVHCDRRGRTPAWCVLRDPGLVLITFENRDYWYSLPAGNVAEIRVEADRPPTCQLQANVRPS